MTSASTSSARYIIGATCSLPVLRPRWWTRASGAPSKGPPTRPSFARNSSITLVFQSPGPVMAVSLRKAGPSMCAASQTSSFFRLAGPEPAGALRVPARRASGGRSAGAGTPPQRFPGHGSAPCVGRRGLALELQGDERLVAHHLGVVAGREPVGVTGPQVALGAVVGGDVQGAGHHVAEVCGLAAVRAGERLDA